MNLRLQSAGLALLWGILELILPAPARAGRISVRRAQEYVLPEKDTLEEQLGLVAQSARFEGTARDDVFVVARNAAFAGSLLNDMWCLAEHIELSGFVADHARLAAARSARIEGRVGTSLVGLSGGSLTVARSADIQGDAWLLGESVTLEGHVSGRALLVGYQVTLGGRVEGSVRILADDIVLLPGTTVGGDLVYTSSKELFLDDRVHLEGRLVRKEAPAPRKATPSSAWADRLLVQAVFAAGALLAGTAWLGLFPGTCGRAVRQLRQFTWRSLLVGFVTLGLVPMLAVALFFTGVGMPLSFLLLLAYLLLLYLGKLVAAMAVGAALLRRRGPQPFGAALAALAVGLLLVYAAALLPFAGPVASFAVTLLGLGALTLSLLIAERGPGLAAVPPPPPKTWAPPPLERPTGTSGT